MLEMLTAIPMCHALCFPMQHTGTSCAATVGLPDTDVHATHPGAGLGALAAPMIKPQSRLRERKLIM
eukprot:285576-Alexandrium_andersonii.AAC.1